MKRLALALTFCAALIGSVFAQGGMGPGPGMVHSTGGGGFSLTAQGSAGSATTGTNSINYGTVSYGSGCNAAIIVVYWYNTAAANTVTALTIGGVSASHVAGSLANDTVGGGQSIDMWQLNSPAGSSGAVAVTYSANVTYNSNVTAYCLVSGTTAVSNVAVAGGACATASPPNTAVTVPAGGAAITASSTASGATIAWTNATADSFYNGGGTYDAWGHTTATGSVTVTATPSGSTSCALSLASWGP